MLQTKFFFKLWDVPIKHHEPRKAVGCFNSQNRNWNTQLKPKLAAKSDTFTRNGGVVARMYATICALRVKQTGFGAVWWRR